MHFPQELVEAFIDCLKAECPPGPSKLSDPAFDALLACSLVSKSFGFPAHRYLFSSICFDPYPSVLHRGYRRVVGRTSKVLVRIQSLCDLLASPLSNLKWFITSVSLAVNDNPLFLSNMPDFQDEVEKLLSEIVGLTSLSLNAMTAMLWSAMGEPTTEMLDRLCCLKTLKRISLTRFADVPMDLILRSSVTSMRLEKTWFDQEFDMAPPATGNEWPVTLRNIRINSYLHPFWAWFSKVDGARNSNIEMFSIGFALPDDIAFFPNLLEELPNTLKGLQLYVSRIFDQEQLSSTDRSFRCNIRSLSGMTDFEECVQALNVSSSRLIHLRDFSIVLALGDRFFPAPNTDIHPRGWFISLDDINPPSQIRNVVFTVEMRITQDDFSRFQDLLLVDDQQEKIDIGLLHRQRFPDLKRLIIHLDITIRPSPSTTAPRNIFEVRSTIEEKMRSLLVIPLEAKDVVQIICTSSPTSPALRSFFQN